MLEYSTAKFGSNRDKIVIVNGRRDDTLSGMSGVEIAKTLAERRANAKPSIAAKRRMAAAIAERETALKKAGAKRV